jgi:hypothetical protein
MRVKQRKREEQNQGGIRNWSAPFRILANPVTNLLFTILIKSSQLSSFFRRLEALSGCQFQATLRTIEWSEELIDRNRNNLFHSCDITSIGHLPPLEFDF